MQASILLLTILSPNSDADDDSLGQLDLPCRLHAVVSASVTDLVLLAAEEATVFALGSSVP
jgi:hypothetical protein